MAERRSKAAKTEKRDWSAMWAMAERLLKERSGEGLEAWNRRVRVRNPKSEQELRAWLSRQGVTGYAQTLLVMERFGYPAHFTADADALIDGQYADRPHLRPILDAVLQAAAGLGKVVIQARKTYVSLVGPRRTFARVQATTKDRVDLGLRLERQKPGGRLRPSRIHETMKVQIELRAAREVDKEVLAWLRKAYEEGRQAETGRGEEEAR